MNDTDPNAQEATAPTEGTWTFVGHWENDAIVVEYVLPGDVPDDRIDTGYWEQGLWAAAGSGATPEAAQAATIAQYVPARCSVCDHRVERADPADPESYVHAEDGDWGDHTAQYTDPTA